MASRRVVGTDATSYARGLCDSAPETNRHRGQGVGSALSERAVEEARSLGVRKLFLFTFDMQELYARLGWELLERTEYLGAQVCVMVRRLAA